MRIYLPYRAEFGHIVMTHAPQVHAGQQGQLDKCVVCCEAGNEALYPGADMFWPVERRDDKDRREFLEAELLTRLETYIGEHLGSGHEYICPDPKAERRYFVPKPVINYPVDCDIVICPRRRDYGPDKNWPYWALLASRLAEAGYSVGACGAPDSSDQAIGVAWKSWEFPRFLDATIAAMLRAKLVIATDNGLAHLAVLCGRPLAIICYRKDLVAPGSDDKGREYWPIHKNRYARANHQHSPINFMDYSWENVDKIVHEAGSMICG